MKKILYILCFFYYLFFIKNLNFIFYACVQQSNVSTPEKVVEPNINKSKTVTPVKIVIPNVNKGNGGDANKNLGWRKVETYIFDCINRNKVVKKVTYTIPYDVKFRQNVLKPIEFDESFKDFKEKL